MSGVELFNANRATTTVSSGGTTAPAGGTSETWTVTSSAAFGAAATGVSQFHVADPAAPSEMIAVTNVSGTTWTVTRGAESTTPVPHATGFTVYQVVTTGWLTAATSQLAETVWVNADPTGAVDATAALNAAIAALPVVSGLSCGAVQFGPGVFRLNSTPTDPGPQVEIRGAGRWATTLMYYGSADCLRIHNPNYPSTGVFTSITGWGGGVKALTIDGTNAGAGACGLHIGDCEEAELDLAIQHFNGSGSTGLHLDNSVWWTEKMTAHVMLFDNTSNVVFDVTSPATTVAAGSNGGTISAIATWGSSFGGNGVLDVASTAGFGTSGTVNVAASGATTAVVTYTGTTATTLTGCAYVSGSPAGTVSTGGAVTLVTSTSSFAYNDLAFDIFANPNQDGVVIQNGAKPYHGNLTVRGNFLGSAGAQTSAVLRITGTVPAGHPSAGAAASLVDSYLNIQVEAGSGAHQPQTVVFGGSSNQLIGCFGIMNFSDGGGTFAHSSITVSTAAGQFWFDGAISGDTNLNPASGTGGQFATLAAKLYGQSFMSGANGNTFTASGDFFSCTLSANITVNLGPSSQNGGVAPAGPQRKTIVIKQNATGGGSANTVTWPHNGSPTTASPTVLWAGGTPPTMTATANAVDVYKLDTLDGATWYGSAIQNVS